VRAAAAWTHRKPDLGEQLAFAHGGHVGPDVKVLHPDHPFPVGATDHGLRLDRRADGREILGRVRLAQRAADRAAVAHDRVGDHGLGVAKEWEVLGEQLGAQQIHMACQRPDQDLIALLADVGELREIVDVDHVLRVRESKLHHRKQAVAARDDSRFGTKPLKRFDRALDARRALVLE